MANEYAIVPLQVAGVKAIRDYLNEFLANGETCNVMWRMKEISAEEFLKEDIYDTHTIRFAVLDSSGDDFRILGVCRVTPTLRSERHGKLGYSVRPSERGRGIAPYMILQMEKMFPLCSLTACIGEDNTASLKAVEKAGWVRTGRMFDWKPNPAPRKAIEMRPPDRSGR